MPTPNPTPPPLSQPPGSRRLTQLSKREEIIPTFSKSFGSFVVEVAKVILISLAIIIPVRYFLIQPFYVKGASMEPNFHDNEYLIIDELSYRLGSPHRGDVVVLHNPRRESEFFIKRVIGLPGETITISDGQVTITNTDHPDGFVLKESYLSKGLVTSGTLSTPLAANEYYVLGDNRPSSLDSRVFGPIDRRELIGRTWIRAWPPQRVRAFSGVTY